LEDLIQYAANAKFAVVLGICMVFLRHLRGVRGKDGQSLTLVEARSYLLGSFTHTAALYVSLVLFSAAFFSFDVFSDVIHKGFGETELWLALLACVFESLIALARNFDGASVA
jgi:hypothetical protein